ncbi:hypothetical protein GWK47_006057 [Chionoecetes opilio]|uniref:Protein kinase domain-containing protein n=1 Tax=Chionoecetes opilio TaxID=41210 RepID=A0A8J4YJ34_CHIOP|nr:hypothetical protein GWK47_006057 [Chionoecetes opilio]
MELCPGEPLEDWLRRGEVRTCLEALVQVCGVVRRLHARGITHGDIHERNVLVDVSKAGQVRAFLLDFGAASRGAALCQQECDVMDVVATALEVIRDLDHLFALRWKLNMTSNLNKVTALLQEALQDAVNKMLEVGEDSDNHPTTTITTTTTTTVNQGTKIVGLGYDGRKDKTRAMVPDSYGKLHPRLIREEHVSVTEEPSGRYLWHFVPEDPVPPEKPAFKVAQALYDLLVTYDSTDSLIVLQGDSTRANTGWKGGTHAHLEKMLGRKLFWSICLLHTNELPLRHLITSIDGPTSSDTGFTGPVCSLLSSVNEMQYNAEFRGVPGGEDLTEIPEYILVNMSTDQQVSYQLVQAVKRGVLPSELQEIKCGKVSHSRWLTTAQSLMYMWTRKHGLTGKELNTLEILVKYCLQVYFKLYYDIKVHHRLEDGPKHILTQLRVMRSQPKKVQTAVTFYVRTECVLLSLMASQSEDDRRFAVTQILKLRAGEEYEDTSIQEILVKPYEVPEFSIHTQSTERVVKQVAEAAAAVVGQQARDGFIRTRAHHRETMPCFRSKKDMMDTF